MQVSGMLGHLLEVACEVECEVSNFVPHPGIRIEGQAANGNSGDEFTSSGKKLFDQTLVFGEEQNIAHQAPDGFRGRQLIDAVLGTLLQKKQSRDRGGAVLTGPGQLSGERCAECRVTVGVGAQVGNFVGSRVMSGGASRVIVVLPAPDTPENRYAWPSQMALAACSRNPPRCARIRLCRMRSTESREYGLAFCRTLPRPVRGSQRAWKSPRLMSQSSPSQRTRTSSSETGPVLVRSNSSSNSGREELRNPS